MISDVGLEAPRGHFYVLGLALGLATASVVVTLVNFKVTLASTRHKQKGFGPKCRLYMLLSPY